MLIESIASVLLAYLISMFPTAYVVSLLSAGVDIRRLSSDDPSPLGTPLTVATQVAPPATATTVVTLEPTPELHGVMVPQLCRDD